jgi:hypothetical protein
LYQIIKHHDPFDSNSAPLHSEILVLEMTEALPIKFQEHAQVNVSSLGQAQPIPRTTMLGFNSSLQ